MASYLQTIERLAKNNLISEMQFVGRSLIEISKATKKKNGFLKIGVSDELASNYLMGRGDLEKVGIMIHVNAADWKKVIEELESESIKEEK